MRLLRPLAAGLAALAMLAPAARADAPPSPLRLIPDQSELLVEVKQPRRLAEGVVGLDLLKQLQTFSIVREQLDSTNARKFRQLVAYFEKELDVKWPDLVDQVAGGGMALGVKYGGEPPPALLVIQGKDEKQVARFAKAALDVIEQELARQESKERRTEGKYNDVETVRIGDGFHLAVAGSAILISNNEEALHKGLDLHLGKATKSMADVAGVADAAKLLPQDSLATVWLNLDVARKAPGADAFFKTPRDPAIAVQLGSYVDALSRAPYVCGALAPEKDGLLLTFRTPTGRDGAGVETPLHIPGPGQPGSRPLLEPKGVLFSYSFYLDLKAFWDERAKIFGADRAKAIEEFDKNSGRFLSGAQMSKLFSQSGPYHRIVVVNQPKYGYKVTPKANVEAFAVVSELREPEAFAKSLEPTLRGAALLASTQVKLKLAESTHAGCKIVGWRFPEDAPLKIDVNDLRFGFSPCFTRVGNQFVVCSTVELCEEMIDILQKEAKEGARGEAAVSRMRLYADGLADQLSTVEDILVTQAVLDQALSADEARTQVRAALSLLRRLGSVSLEADLRSKEFHYDFRIKMTK
jgi:hypothetical protein